MFLVYAITHNVPIIETEDGAVLFIDPDKNNHVYIGYTSRSLEERMKDHKKVACNIDYKCSKKLYNCIRKYDWKNFDKTILIDGIPSEKDAKDTEVNMISLYNSFHKGLNSTPGGDGIGSRENHNQARKVVMFDGEHEHHFDWIGGCAEAIGRLSGDISQVLNYKNPSEQIFSPVLQKYVQIKYIEDDTPFVKDMPTHRDKISGENHGQARKIKGFDNISKKIIFFNYIYQAVEELDLVRGIEFVLSGKHEQIYSRKLKRYFQFKYIEDDTPFIRNMLSPFEKISLRNSKRVCVFGKLYVSAKNASDILQDTANTKTNGNFIANWITRNKYNHNIFYVSCNFYDEYKNYTEEITKEMYDEFMKKQKI